MILGDLVCVIGLLLVGFACCWVCGLLFWVVSDSRLAVSAHDLRFSCCLLVCFGVFMLLVVVFRCCCGFVCLICAYWCWGLLVLVGGLS